MARIFEYIKRLALAFWLGEMLFFALVFAPRVFTVLPRPEAALLQASIFPAYFAVGVICAVIILISMLMGQMASGTGLFSKSERLSYHADRLKVLPLLITVVGGCIFAYCLLSLTPKIASLQATMYDAAAATTVSSTVIQERFHFLHHLSTVLNGIVLFMLLALVAVI